MTIEEQVKKILLANLEAPESAITPDAALRSTLGATSVDLVEILADLENAFDLEISEEEAQVLRTPGDIVKFIATKTG